MRIFLSEQPVSRCQKMLIGGFVISAFMISGCATNDPPPPPVNPVVIDTTKAVNINTADVDELRRIPHVGDVMARRIIVFRSENGPFENTEQLMLIQGMSDKRFREIRHLIYVDAHNK